MASKALFPKKVTFTGSRVGTQTYLSTIQPSTHISRAEFIIIPTHRVTMRLYEMMKVVNSPVPDL